MKIKLLLAVAGLLAPLLAANAPSVDDAVLQQRSKWERTDEDCNT